jgi:hypothetical protein
MQIDFVVFGEIDTPSYRFEVAGRSEKEVETALKRAWKKHQKQTGATWSWEEIEPQYRRMVLGLVYRDGELLV